MKLLRASFFYQQYKKKERGFRELEKKTCNNIYLWENRFNDSKFSIEKRSWHFFFVLVVQQVRNSPQLQNTYEKHKHTKKSLHVWMRAKN